MSTENQFNTNKKKLMKAVGKSAPIEKNLPTKKSEKDELPTKKEEQISSIATVVSRINSTEKIRGLNYSKNVPVFERLKNKIAFQASGLAHLKHKNNSLSFKMAQNLVDSTDQLKLEELTSSNKLNGLKGWPTKFAFFKSMTHFEKPFPYFKNAASNATKKSPFPNIKMGDELSEKQPLENNLINFKTNATNDVKRDVYVPPTPVKPLENDQIDLIMQVVLKALGENLCSMTKPFLTKMELFRDELNDAFIAQIQSLTAQLNPQPQQDEELMEAEEVIKLLKISKSTFYRHKKNWKCLKVGAKSFYYKSEIFQQLRYHLK